MNLVLRRAARARGLLAAASTATLLAVVLLTALSLYGGQVIDSGTRAAVKAAPVAERTILVTGSVQVFDDADTLQAAVHQVTDDGLGGAPVSVAGAGYAVGQQLPPRLGNAQPGADGLMLASVVYLEGVATQADLVDGAWPEPGRSPIQTALAEPVARLFDVSVGDEIPLTDRRTGEVRTVQVSGIFTPLDRNAPYWRLVPELATGYVSGTATYGPLVVDRADFAAHFGELASVNWLITPDLSRVTAPQLTQVQIAASALPDALADASDGRLEASTRLNELTDRLARSAVVARSALLIPALLLVVIAGYALLLVAGLLADQRRSEDALIRARGAGSWQVLRLTAAEAGLVVAPALLLGAPLAVAVLHAAESLPWLRRVGLTVDVALTPQAFLVAAAAALGCAVTMCLPALRPARTYVAEQQAKSRVVTRTLVQRTGGDLALVGLAVLAWLQLVQYDSPLLGLTIDPVLVAAPTIGLLAATVLALRILPWLTRAVQRLAARRSSFATLLGTWQAGRRRRAGTVLLLSLAVGVATVAICLESTSQRSLVDQASHRAGADLRLVEIGRTPSDRAEQLVDTPGVTDVLPALTSSVTVGSDTNATVLAMDAARAVEVMQPRADLTDEPAGALFDRLTTARSDDWAISLPDLASQPGAQLTGKISVTSSQGADRLGRVTTRIDVRDRFGVLHTLTVDPVPANSETAGFTVDLPAYATDIYGFRLDTSVFRYSDTVLRWRLEDVAVTGSGRSEAIDLRGGWRSGRPVIPEVVTTGQVEIEAAVGQVSASQRFRVYPGYRAPVYRPLDVAVELRPAARLGQPVPVLVTPGVLRGVGASVGDSFTLPMPGGDMPATVTGVIESVPGVENPNAVVADLDTVVDWAYAATGTTLSPNEWRLATRAAQHDAAAERLAAVTNVELVDRYAVAYEPFGAGARLVLLPAAFAVALLAALGVAVDARATARSRSPELAVLYTIGTSPRTLARTLIAEQSLLAGLGVVSGLGIGVLVAWVMGPSLVLAPDASRPVPEPLVVADPVWITVVVAGLLLVTFSLATTVAAGIRRNLAVLVLGQER